MIIARIIDVRILQLSSLGRKDDQLPELRISYRTRVYSDIQQDITHAYAVDIIYRHPNRDFMVSISTDVDERTADSFSVMVNGLTMTDPVWRPLLLEEILVKQMTNFIIVVSSVDFRVEFDVGSRIYVSLDPRFENKVRLLTVVLFLVVVAVKVFRWLLEAHANTDVLRRRFPAKSRHIWMLQLRLPPLSGNKHRKGVGRSLM